MDREYFRCAFRCGATEASFICRIEELIGVARFVEVFSAPHGLGVILVIDSRVLRSRSPSLFFLSSLFKRRNSKSCAIESLSFAFIAVLLLERVWP